MAEPPGIAPPRAPEQIHELQQKLDDIAKKIQIPEMQSSQMLEPPPPPTTSPAMPRSLEASRREASRREILDEIQEHEKRLREIQESERRTKRMLQHAESEIQEREKRLHAIDGSEELQELEKRCKSLLQSTQKSGERTDQVPDPADPG